MRYAHEGMTLWTGTQDAPGPGEAVSADTAIPIMIGVQPVNASNQMEVRYCVNEEPPQKALASWIRNDPSGKAQYFKAELPAFQEGDTVEYAVICRCAGRQIPPPEEVNQTSGSFNVTASSLQQASLRKGQLPTTKASYNPLASKGQAISSKQSPIIKGAKSAKSKADLERVAHLTPRAIETAEPSLSADIKNRLVDNLSGFVAARTAGQSPELQAAVKRLRIPAEVLSSDRTVGEVVVNELRHSGSDEQLMEEAELTLSGEGEPRVSDVVGFDQPIASNPAFRPQLEAARLVRLGEAMELPERIVSTVADAGVTLETLDEERLEELVTENGLSVGEANILGASTSLYRVLDERPELVKAVRALDAGVKLPEDLVNFTDKDWRLALEGGKVEPPRGLSHEHYARALRKKIEELFPTRALAVRLARVETMVALGGLADIRVLSEKNLDRPIIGAADFDSLDTMGIETATLDPLRTRYEKLVALSRQYPGMGIAEILDDLDTSPPDKERAVRGRVERVNQFFADNPDALAADLTNGSDDIKGLQFATESATERTLILSVVRSYQRIYTVTSDVADMQATVATGYTSALTIAQAGLNRFTTATGFEPETAKAYFDKALAIVPMVTGYTGTIIDLLKGGFGDTAVANIAPQIDEYLKALPGYEDFFGSQDYCHCEHCRSILSPAAYFADLMCFVDQKVTQTYFTGAKEHHVLNLAVRRPDLWTLPLTCDNTHHLVSYLEIINEILENYIASAEKKAEDGFAGDFNDRVAVAEAVYKNRLKDTTGSFVEPFNLPFEELKLYLTHFSRKLRDIAHTVGVSGDPLARLSVALSPEEYALIIITEENTSLDFLQRIYGINFNESSGKINKFDAQRLLKRTGINRGELGELVQTRFITANGADAIEIRGEKRLDDSVQNDIERIYGLTRAALDRLHRFARLWRATPWTVGELDLVLTHIMEAGVASDIEREALVAMGRLLDLQERLRTSPEELLALFSLLPVHPVKQEAQSLLDRLFNLKSFVDAGGLYPKVGTEFLHPAFQDNPSGERVDRNLHRLQAGTRTGDEEFYQLVVGLAQPLGIDWNALNEDGKTFALSRQNLSTLYRHARVAKLLRLSPPQLFELIAVAPNIAGPQIESLDNLVELVDFHRWWKTTKWSLDDLSLIVGRTPANPSAYPDPNEIAIQVVEEAEANNLLTFAGTVFAFVEGVTEEQSQAIIKANHEAILPAPDGTNYWLKKDFDRAAALTVPEGITAAESDLRAVLLDYHSPAVLSTLVPGKLRTAPETFTDIAELLGEDLGHTDYLRILRGELAPERLQRFLRDALPLTRLFADQEIFDGERLDFIASNPKLFGIDDFHEVDITSVQHFELFRTLLEPWRRSRENAPNLGRLLKSFTPTTKFTDADQDALATLLQCEVGLSLSLQEHLNLAETAFEALGQLRRAVSMAQHLGVGGGALHLATSADYDELTDASTAVLSAFRAKYEDEVEWQAKIEPFYDHILSRKRDGLVAYLLYSMAPQFDEARDLYHYFFLDVELEGCARTSRVVAAISSVQLYVQRVLMNLEETPPSHADPVHISPESIPPDEWEWRKNYRVWEANRKVFLYPENYTEPELRDNKTPLFEELEQNLLAQDINEDNVREAYARYMRGFEEVSRLKIAGTWHEKNADDREDVLHLFGVTSDDPPVFYYRRVENMHYGVSEDGKATHWWPWQKVDVQISARTVSPIIYQGRLYVFWVTITTRPHNEWENGTSEFAGYRHHLSVHYTIHKLDGSWTTPQTVSLVAYPFRGYASTHSVEKFRGDGEIIENLFFDERPLYSTEQHREPVEGYTLSGFAWDRVYPSIGLTSGGTNKGQLNLRGADFKMWSPLNLYQMSIGDRLGTDPSTVGGVPWIEPTPMGCFLQSWGLGFPSNRILWSEVSGANRVLYNGMPGCAPFENYTYASVALYRDRYETYKHAFSGLGVGGSDLPQWRPLLTGLIDTVFEQRHQLIAFDNDKDLSLAVVNGSPQDGLVDVAGEIFHLQEGGRNDNKYHLRRLNTSVASDIARALFTRGMDHLLATETQLCFNEHSLPFDIKVFGIPTDTLSTKEAPSRRGVNLTDAGFKVRELQHNIPLVPDFAFYTQRVVDATNTGTLDYEGPMGVYLREIFFHIPFLIANHLNSKGDYAGAQRWYHYIFDPSANEMITGLDPELTDEEQRRRELDRNWRYREFRGLDLETLRCQLTNDAAIETYKKDPFNPHAIARLRLSAYQKSIVMKYIDNLIDWGDQLFARDTMESINEATLLYVMASEILGPRPAQLGDCGEGENQPRCFENIKQAMVNGSEFLAEVESLVAGKCRRVSSKGSKDHFPGSKVVSIDIARKATEKAYRKAIPREVRTTAVAEFGTGSGIDFREVATGRTADPVDVDSLTLAMYADRVIAGQSFEPDKLTIAEIFKGKGARGLDPKSAPSFGLGLVRQVNPVFCVPHNEELIGYWDRVEDRLFKIRHCMNIAGVRRQLALFAPPIDPRLLVRARAAGLSIDEVLSATGGDLPPYRFSYLIERAKAYVATLQNFGSALSAAIEKRDAEELARIRNLHERNIIELTTEIRTQEIKTAEEAIKSLERRQEAAEYRRGYYDGLINEGLIVYENIQETSQYIASTLGSDASVLELAGAIAYLVPEFGSPPSLNFGGKEAGDMLNSWAQAFRTASGVSGAVSAVAGMEAGFKRREQEWEHQKKLVEHELKSLEPELEGARIRKEIAERSLHIHEKSVEQTDEIMEFFDQKFSNLGLYTYLTSTLQRLYREAYNMALRLARLAEAAYRFERDDDTALLSGDYWDASRAGLLAGEKLLLELNKFEQRFLETNYRTPEINQSFSVGQIDPAALVQLKTTGSCEFSIPEFYFDLFYPGHYKRRVKAVRLTIPCVTGPYTNVSGKLTLLASYVRKEPQPGQDKLIEMPRTRSISMATSTAQNDAGVFELNFRDERYMPFEGSGAISRWKLELPTNFRPFDYETISDVILSISYVAAEDEGGMLRGQVEELNGTLLDYLSKNNVTRIFSLRQEFSSTYHRLLDSPLGTSVNFELSDKNFPLFLQGRDVKANSASLILNVPKDQPPGDVFVAINGAVVSVAVNGAVATEFSKDSRFGDLPSNSLDVPFGAGLKGEHSITLIAAGDLAASVTDSASVVDTEKLRDILLYVEFQLA